MKSSLFNSLSLRSRRIRARRRGIKPAVAEMERRQLLASSLFLQGVAFIDVNANGTYDQNDQLLPDAQITLYRKDGETLTPIETQYTDSNGYYLFNDQLTPGDYRLAETLRNSSLFNSGTEVLSQFNPATAVDAQTIDVTLVDLNSIQAKYVARTQARTVTVAVSPNYGSTQGSPTTLQIGTSQVSLEGPGIANPDATFPTFSVDAIHPVAPGDTYPVQPSNSPLPPGWVVNSGQIGFLYNQLRRTDLDSAHAAGLQLAIWKLEYDVFSTDLSTGNFRVIQADQDVLDAANDYLHNLSYTNFEPVAFLNATSMDPTTIGQGFLARDSLNFANQTSSSLSGSVFDDANNNGIFDDAEAPPGEPGRHAQRCREQRRGDDDHRCLRVL